MRKNGLELPLNAHQVGSGVIFFLLVGSYAALSAPYLPIILWTSLLPIYGALALTSLFLNLLTTAINPSDPGVTGAAPATDPTYYCAHCQVSVQAESKHCRTCDRCVERFDHHCVWLNNCIGRANYNPFFGLLWVTSTLVSLQLGTNVYLFTKSYVDPPASRHLQSVRYGGRIPMGALRALWLGFAIVSCLVCAAVGELLLFHMVLRYKRLSTYDYILAQREAHEAKWSDVMNGQQPESPRQRPRTGGCRCCPWPANQVLPAVPPGGVSPRPHEKHVVRVNLCGAIWLVCKDCGRQGGAGQAGPGPGQGTRPQCSLESEVQLPYSERLVGLSDGTSGLALKALPEDAVLRISQP